MSSLRRVKSRRGSQRSCHGKSGSAATADATVEKASDAATMANALDLLMQSSSPRSEDRETPAASCPLPRLRREHRNGSNQCFDRGRNGLTAQPPPRSLLSALNRSDAPGNYNLPPGAPDISAKRCFRALEILSARHATRSVSTAIVRSPPHRPRRRRPLPRHNAPGPLPPSPCHSTHRALRPPARARRDRRVRRRRPDGE